MSKDITIPPEAVEKAAMAMFDATPFREHDGAFCEQSERYQAFTRVLATAALRAGIAAWPGVTTTSWFENGTRKAVLNIPLPLEVSDE